MAKSNLVLLRLFLIYVTFLVMNKFDFLFSMTSVLMAPNFFMDFKKLKFVITFYSLKNRRIKEPLHPSFKLADSNTKNISVK